MGNALSSAVAEAPAVGADRGKLERYLRAYWLRPLNALWMTLRSDALDRVAFVEPSVDLACGDGVFNFLHSGGEFDLSFDVFTVVTDVPGGTDGGVDMYDRFDESYRPHVVVPPHTTRQAGADAKRNLIAKAERLKLYRKLVQHDLNQPLPFADGAFRTVYCNAAYWVEAIDDLLSEIRRIAAPGGQIVLQVKLDSILACTLARHRPVLGDRWLEIISRGRFDCWPTLTDRAGWEKRFHAAGLSIEDVVPVAMRTHAHLWDIGLRPIAPLLVKMASALDPTTRSNIKSEWIDLLAELLAPFCDRTLDLLPGPAEPVELQYVLRPR